MWRPPIQKQGSSNSKPTDATSGCRSADTVAMRASLCEARYSFSASENTSS
jgi:hypothetical protein